MLPTSHSLSASLNTCRKFPALSLIFVAALSLALVLPPGARASGTTWHVSPGGAGACTPADPNCTSIQAAVNAASSGDTIQVAAGTYKENVTVSKSLTVSGAGAAQTTVDGTQSAAVFHINPGLTVSLSGMTITNGKPILLTDFAGGIDNEGSTTTITGCNVSNNVSDIVAAAGITNSGGTMTVKDSTISNNFNSNPNGDAGGIESDSPMNVTNCTISNNFVNNQGGGISGNGMTTVTSSTISGNSAANGGGGILNFDRGGLVNVRSSIVAGNSAPIGPDVSGQFNSQMHNLIGKSDGSTGFTNGTNKDIVGSASSPVDARLAPLGNYGGPTQTQILLGGSPAIDAGDDTVSFPIPGLTTDQRGFPRQVGAHVDIGAVEVSYAMSIKAGDGQTTPINSAFATQLQVTVTESGNPVSGIPVTFNAPATGASGTFQGTGTNTATVNTDSNGVATAPVLTANGIVGGSYDVTASLGSASAPSVAFALTNTKANQTITFGPLPGKTFGDPDFTVSASASSGLPVSLTVLGNCTISGSTVHITGAGTCTVTASQPGDSNYNAAPTVQQSFQIAKANQTIIFGPLIDRKYGNRDFGVSATGGASGNPVTFSATGNCTMVSTNLVRITGAGSCTITASQAGDSNYNPAADVPQSFQIAKASVFVFPFSSANPSAPGQAVTFSAGISPSSPSFFGSTMPSGTIRFQVDHIDVTNTAPSTFTTSTLTPGSHGITAIYSGDANFNPSSTTITQFVGTGFAFAQVAFGAGERDGSVSITVKRTGDTTTAVSVDYATDDGSTPSVAVPCSAVTRNALERCDYTRAAGTLNFAPGETQKNFTVLINEDSYAEGDETLTLRLSNPTGGVLGTFSSIELQITDNSPEFSGNPSDDSSFFVRQHYHDFLSREPDDAGLQFWTSGITGCGADTNCVAVKRINTSAAFFLSIEFQETGFLVERMYKTAYGDTTGVSTFPSLHTLTVPVVRLKEFLLDTQRIGQGVVVGVGDWQTQLQSNKNTFAEEFVSRQRFHDAGLLSLSPAQYVDKLNQNAGGILTQSERDGLVAQLTSGDTPAARASVLRQVAENPALKAAESNRAFVLMQFFGYLRRNPNDAPDADYTGYDFWLQKLNQFGGNFVQAEMVKAFITSTEYRQRFGQP